ncbi:MAG: DUF6263 family protein [Planctomycetota bacterium]|nr:DUF6263 family protein [Planctomycetota bacterium]
MKRIVLLSLFATCLLNTQAFAQDTQPKKITLRWKWKQGQVLRYRMSQAQNQSMTGFQTMNVESETVYYWDQKVESVDADGNAVVSITYKRVIQSSKGNGPAMKFDSDDKEANRQDPQIKILTALIDKPFKMKVSPSGKVSKVVGVDKIANGIIKDLGQNPAMAQAAEIIRSQLSNKAIGSQMETSLRILPEKAVPIGHKWTRGPEKKEHPMGSIETKDNITFKSIENKKERNLAVIIIDHDMKMNMTNKNNPALKMFDIDTKFKGNQSIFRFDIDGGYLKKQVHRFTMDMKFTGKQQKGMDLDQEVKQTMTVLLMSVKEPKSDEKPKTGTKKKF